MPPLTTFVFQKDNLEIRIKAYNLDQARFDLMQAVRDASTYNYIG